MRDRCILYSIIVLICFSCSSNEDKLKRYVLKYPNGSIKLQGYKDYKGDSVGVWISFNSSKDTVVKLVFENGSRVKKVIYDQYRQFKSCIVNYQKGIPHGSYTTYFKKGKVYNQGTFTNGKKTGVWKEYDQYGDLRVKRDFTDKSYYKVVTHYDLENEVEKKLYYSDSTERHCKIQEFYLNGKVKLEANFVNGLGEGKMTKYYRNGELKLECEFKNDKVVSGSIKKYTEKGELVE